ncbi:MAG: DUF1553 domain-containing protein [Fuerstiella sp.]|nr:DUF1553 domain-containing protein [Fuerstiella sp.]
MLSAQNPGNVYTGTTMNRNTPDQCSMAPAHDIGGNFVRSCPAVVIRTLWSGVRFLTFVIVAYSYPVVYCDAATSDQVEFNRDVRPILSLACVQCHGPDVNRNQANLRLDRPAELFAERNGKRVLVAGSASESELFRRITSNNPDQHMPPADSGHVLTTEQIELIRKWIDQGAEWQEHWSFVPPTRPSVPSLSDTDWPKNTIDHFILARLQSAGLRPSSQADKLTLIRRLTFDITGLPPAPEEVSAFLADESSEAWENAVNRLLESPAYGERMALNWLDAARYADTHGYHEDYHRDMWPWRDWVINSFNSNMPFDQFTIEQLAGDLLPERTHDQVVATGFNRNHGVTASGISEEYRVEYVLDRVRTTSTVWLGLTMHCAQCHDHKYDPISQAEFYEFFAYFNSVADKGVENRMGNVDPILEVESPELSAKLATLTQQITRLEQARQRRDSEVAADASDSWEKQLSVQDGVRTIKSPEGLLFHYPLDAVGDDHVRNAAGKHGHGTLQGNATWTNGRFADALNCNGRAWVDLGDAAEFERTDSFSYGAWIFPGGDGPVIARFDGAVAGRSWDVVVAGKHVEARMVHFRPDDAIHVKTTEQLELGQWTHVFVTYDGSSRARGLRIYFDGRLQSVSVQRDALTGTISTETPLYIGRRHTSDFFPGAIDDVRIYGRCLTTAEVSTLADTNPAVPVLATAAENRTGKQRQVLRQYYLANHDAEYRQLSNELDRLRILENEVGDQAKKLTVMVMQDMTTPRETFVLKRGAYDQHGQLVQPGTPKFLPPLVGTSEPGRLTLARWLVTPDHPLTSRVTVNRLWQMIFGTGIVKTSEDFGTQGELPSHPELLDWLATEFVRVGWDVRQIVKLIVTSATYQQSSKISPASFDRDPENRLLSRGPRFRLAAEFIRDNALAVSGLLVQRVGGPSVKPYQPPGLWMETSNRGYDQDHGSNLYRRSLYSYWKRSVPLPNMFAIDAPTRELCTVRRQRTNTPLMALVMMNDPTFVEAARALAENAMTNAVLPLNRIEFMFTRATTRQPKAVESDVLLTVYERQRDVFGRNDDAALKLLTVGESKRNQMLDPGEHAALTTIASIILNMDETITKE